MEHSPLIITCAVIGAELTETDSPYLPLIPDDIAKSAIEAVNAGAHIIHLHVRDENGKPSQRVDLFERVSKAIRKECDCILQYSTGGAVGTALDERVAPLKLKPEMATLSMGTMNFGEDIFENSEVTIRTISSAIQNHGVVPELEIFDCGMLDTAYRFIRKGHVPEKHHIDFVLGVPGGMSGDLKNLMFLVEQLKPEQSWSVAGIGRYQLPLTTHAIAMGGHVRVGFEDNIYYKKGELAKSNAQFISRIKWIATELNRPVATLEQVKDIVLGIC